MKKPVIIKTREQIVIRLGEMGREILATFAKTGNKNVDQQIDELLGTLFACLDETANEIQRVCA